MRISTARRAATVLLSVTTLTALGIGQAAAQTWDGTSGTITITHPDGSIIIDLANPGTDPCPSDPVDDPTFDFDATGGVLTVNDLGLSARFQEDPTDPMSQWYEADIGLLSPPDVGTYQPGGPPHDWDFAVDVVLSAEIYSITPPNNCALDPMNLECELAVQISVDGEYTGDIEAPATGDVAVMDLATVIPPGIVTQTCPNLFLGDFDGETVTGTNVTLVHQ